MEGKFIEKYIVVDVLNKEGHRVDKIIESPFYMYERIRYFLEDKFDIDLEENECHLNIESINMFEEYLKIPYECLNGKCSCLESYYNLHNYIDFLEKSKKYLSIGFSVIYYEDFL